jgi:hypothetical protein
MWSLPGKPLPASGSRRGLPKVAETGKVKDLTDQAWSLVKHGLRGVVSIGFKPDPESVEFMANGGYRYKLFEWLELSLISIAANREAKITAFR